MSRRSKRTTPQASLAAALALVVAGAVAVPAVVVSAGPGPVQRAAAVAAPTPVASRLAARMLEQGVLPHGRAARIAAEHATPADPAADPATKPARPLTAAGASAPPTTGTCRAQTGLACYSVRQLAAAYGVPGAHRAGWTGRGATVVLPIWMGAPQEVLRHDLAVLSKAYGLPPARVQVRTAGVIPPMPAPDAADALERYALAEETTLDAAMVHAIAPHARIVVLAVPGSEGDADPYTRLLAASRAYTARHPGVIVSMSYGTFESDADPGTMRRWDAQLSRMVHQDRVTVLAAAGNTGNTSGTSTEPNVPWPASSPHVTAVTGTEVTLDEQGRRTAADTVWSDRFGIGLATGGGLSRLFARPSFQNPYADIVGKARGTADVSANASIFSRVIVYSTYNVLGGAIDRDGGWRLIAGTSQAAPLWAGTLALVRQAAHRPLGPVDPALYRLGALGERSGLADVTTGGNAVPGNQGYAAGPGWDLPSGNGTIGDASRLVPVLAAAIRRMAALN